MKVNRIKIRMIYKIMSEKSFSSSLTPFIQTRPGARFLLIQGKTTVPLVRKKEIFLGCVYGFSCKELSTVSITLSWGVPVIATCSVTDLQSPC